MTTTRTTTFTPQSSGFIFASLGALLLAASACGGAATPTTELQTARNVYSQARSGEAAQLNPTGVHEAFQALQAAEKAHEDDAGSERERHYAYIALRKSELAIAEASEALAKQEQQRAEQTYQAQLEQRSRESDQYAQQLTQTQQALQQNSQSLEQQKQELEEARIAAERAQAELRESEALKEEAGRMVISLSGVMFQTGGAQLSEMAQRRLETVVQALRAYPDRAITIEGYTDAQGSEDSNRQLSQKRADAVRAYLESRGVDPGRLRAVGKGEQNPIASNDTAAGRASNRRVEIVVDGAGGTRSAEASGEEATDRQNVSGTDGEAEQNAPAEPSPRAAPDAPPATGSEPSAPPRKSPPAAPPKPPAQQTPPPPPVPAPPGGSTAP